LIVLSPKEIQKTRKKQGAGRGFRIHLLRLFFVGRRQRHGKFCTAEVQLTAIRRRYRVVLFLCPGNQQLLPF
jgi:hypothetical protein